MTRADYIAHRVSHADYYTSIAQAAGISYADSDSLVQRAQDALAQGDEHLNTLPLQFFEFPVSSAAFKEHGDYPTIAGYVCVRKQALKNAATRAK